MKQRDDPPLRLTFEACRSMIIRTVPPHVRHGLLRLYLVVAVPWVIWYGLQLLNLLNRPYVAQRYVNEAFRRLLIVPIGAPLIFLIGVWIVAGFQKSAPASEPSAADPMLPKPADYHPIISRAVAALADNTPEARQAIYERARSVLLTELGGQGTPELQIIIEQDELEAAIRKVEAAYPRPHSLKIDPKTHQPLIASKASTTLLFVSLFFPRIWLIDVTCMSLWWVARLPRGTLHR